jgi:hypothetical protein
VIEVRDGRLVLSNQLVCGAALKVVFGARLQAYRMVEIVDRLFRIAVFSQSGAAQAIRLRLPRVRRDCLRRIFDRRLKIIEFEIRRSPRDPPGRIGRTQLDHLRKVAESFLGLGLFYIGFSAQQICLDKVGLQ